MAKDKSLGLDHFMCVFCKATQDFVGLYLIQAYNELESIRKQSLGTYIK